MELGMSRKQMIEFVEKSEVKPAENVPGNNMEKLANSIVELSKHTAIGAAISLIEENNKLISAQIEDLLKKTQQSK